MKPSRLGALTIAILALTVADDARAAGDKETVVLNTFSSVMVNGDALGPKGEDGVPYVGRNTGCGIMDGNVGWDQTAAAKAKTSSEVLLAAVYTRSDLEPNGHGSYMQGGLTLAWLKKTGVTYGQPLDFPRLEGDRAFMRPLVAITPRFAAVIFASEDNNSQNGNPKPVLFLVDKATGKLAPIANNTREDNNKPTDLIEQALRDGIEVDAPGNQRGPHMLVPVNDHEFLVGMQFNNHAQEAFRVAIDDAGAVKMKWLERYTDIAQHTRPQVAHRLGSKVAFVTGVEANSQPADIGVRVSKIDIETGKAIKSEIVAHSDPEKGKYVTEPSIGLFSDDKIGIGYAMVSTTHGHGNKGNGHAGGAPVPMVELFETENLTRVGDTRMNVAQWSRHAHAFVTTYGPKAEPAIAVISGSSTGTAKGFEQVIPLKSDGTIGLVDPLKVYTVSRFSDVANLQARGKRNPNDQAKGFINGTGSVPNPGYTPTGDVSKSFMPEVSHFSVSVVTGFSGDAAAATGRRESLWLSLVPAAWQPNIDTVPGQPTDKPGTNPDGTGPSPRTDQPATDPSGDSSTPLAPGRRRVDTGSAGGCSIGPSPRSDGTSAIALVFALALSLLSLSLRPRAKEDKR